MGITTGEANNSLYLCPFSPTCVENQNFQTNRHDKPSHLDLRSLQVHQFWFKHIYFVLQLYKHTNMYDNTSYRIRTEAKSL